MSIRVCLVNKDSHKLRDMHVLTSYINGIMLYSPAGYDDGADVYTMKIALVKMLQMYMCLQFCTIHAL